MMKKIAVLTLSVLCLALAGCNTMKGLGEDLQKAGEKIEDAAKKKQ